MKLGEGEGGLTSHLSMEKFDFVESGFALWCSRGLKQLLQGIISCTQGLIVCSAVLFFCLENFAKLGQFNLSSI